MTEIGLCYGVCLIYLKFFLSRLFFRTFLVEHFSFFLFAKMYYPQCVSILDRSLLLHLNANLRGGTPGNAQG